MLKIEDDFTQTNKYRNDLSRLKKSSNSEDTMVIMGYIFRLEKQVQDLKKKLNNED